MSGRQPCPGSCTSRKCTTVFVRCAASMASSTVTLLPKSSASVISTSALRPASEASLSPQVTQIASYIWVPLGPEGRDRKSTRLNSSHGYISYAVFCLKKKKITLQRCLTSYTHYLHRFLFRSYLNIIIHHCLTHYDLRVTLRHRFYRFTLYQRCALSIA